METLHRILTPAERERAEKIGQTEFQQILAALASSKAEASPGAALPPAAGLPASPPDSDQAIGWPKAPSERVRAVQQVLIDLRRLNGKADGIAGPATRAAILDFERSVGLRETGEVSREVYVAALRAIAQNDTVARSPFPCREGVIRPRPTSRSRNPRTSKRPRRPARANHDLRFVGPGTGELRKLPAQP